MNLGELIQQLQELQAQRGPYATVEIAVPAHICDQCGTLLGEEDEDTVVVDSVEFSPGGAQGYILLRQ